MSKRQSQDFEGGRARESVLFIIFLFYSWRLPLTNHKNSVFLISDWCEKSMLHFWPIRCERMSGRDMCVCVCMCMDHIFFIHSSTDGHLTIVNNTEMSIGVHVSF